MNDHLLSSDVTKLLEYNKKYININHDLSISSIPSILV
jgi:hypothetical protein